MRRLLDRPWQTWSVGLGGILGFDAWLVVSGRESLSCGAGRHRAVTAALLAYLALHLLHPARWIARLDPLSLAARRLERRIR